MNGVAMTEKAITIRARLISFLSSPWFKITFSAAILYALIALNRIEFDTFLQLTDTWGWLVIAYLLMLPPYLIVSYRFQLVLQSLEIATSFKMALRWTMIGSFFDLAMPSNSGGDIVKAGYLVKYYGTGKRIKSVMAVAFDRVLGVIGLFLLAFISCLLGWEYIRSLPGSSELAIFIATASIAPLLLFRILGSRKLSNSTRVRNFFDMLPMGERLYNMVACFNSLRENPKQLATVIGLSLLNHIFWCAALFCIVMAFNQSIDVAQGFAVFPIAIFSNVFGFAGGFGVGTAAFDVIFSKLLSIQAGAAIGLTFQILSALSRLSGLPFYLKSST